MKFYDFWDTRFISLTAKYAWISKPHSHKNVNIRYGYELKDGDIITASAYINVMIMTHSRT